MGTSELLDFHPEHLDRLRRLVQLNLGSNAYVPPFAISVVHELPKEGYGAGMSGLFTIEEGRMKVAELSPAQVLDAITFVGGKILTPNTKNVVICHLEPLGGETGSRHAWKDACLWADFSRLDDGKQVAVCTGLPYGVGLQVGIVLGWLTGHLKKQDGWEIAEQGNVGTRLWANLPKIKMPQYSS